jgi:Na+-driven multidrug efflux pump
LESRLSISSKLLVLHFQTSPVHELVAAHVCNCIILLAALFCLEYFLNGINLFLNVYARGTEDAALPMWAFRAMGYAVFFFCSLLLTRPSLDTPDNLVVAFILLSAGVLLHWRRPCWIITGRTSLEFL